jgi:hypothetical protein
MRTRSLVLVLAFTGVLGVAARLMWYAGGFDVCGPGPAVVSISPVASTRQY